MFLRHRRRFGVLGLAGFSLLTVGYLAIFAVQCIVAYVLPTVAALGPGLRPGRPRRGRRWQPERRHRPHAASCSLVSGIGYSLGGLLFGIALFRAGVLARWACRAARLRHHLRPRAVRAAGVLQPPVRGAHRRRADRPRRLAVARPAPAVRDRRRAGDGVGRGAGDPMSTRERSWPVPVALVALSAIPLTAGTLRLIQLAGGPDVLPADHRFAGFPIPLVVHILARGDVRARRDPAVRATVPPPAPGLAPSCRPGAGRGRAARGDLGALADAVLRAAAGHRRRCSTCSAWSSGPRWPPASCSASPPSVAATSRPTGRG